VAYQAINIFKLLLRFFSRRFQAKPNMAFRTPVGDQFPVVIFQNRNPIDRWVGTEIIGRNYFAKLLPICIDYVWGIGFPLVMDRSEYRFPLIGMTHQTGFSAFVRTHIVRMGIFKHIPFAL
jgi:hypothetical protein